MDAYRTTGSTPAGNGQLTALRWISAIISGLIVTTALVVGQGFFGGTARLITDHGSLGNLIFALASVQLVLAFLGYQRGVVGRKHLLLNGFLIILLFAQIGLGYSGSRSGASGALVWHLPVGVLAMGASTLNASLFWIRPTSTRTT